MRKTKIEKKLKKKTNKELVETIILSKKNENWLKVSDKISMPSRKKVSLNLDQINAQAKEKEIIIIPGKVLGLGMITKKIKVAALNFSSSAENKLKESKTEFTTIKEEIKNNPKGKDIKLLLKAK